MTAGDGAVRKILGWAISRSRGTQYKIDSRIHPWSAISISRRRAVEALRGLTRELVLRECGRPLFLGTKVKISSPRFVSVGNGCSIGDGTLIDGLSVEGIFLGDNVTIGRQATIRATGTMKNIGVGVKVGDNSSIGAFSYIGAAGGVVIGANVMMGPFVGIYAENHKFDELNTLIRDQGVSRSGIHVGDNCWIGSSAIILDGVSIGNGCVVGAGSLVASSVEDNTVVAGVPARIIRKRGERR